MSEQYWDNDQFDDDVSEETEQPQRNPVRSALKAKERENKGLTDQLSALQEQVALLVKRDEKNTIKELAASKGLPVQVVNLYTGEATPEAFEVWLTEYGSVFGAQSTSPVVTGTGAEGTDVVVSPAEQAALEAMNNASAATAGGGTELIDRIKGANFTSMKDLEAFFKANQQT